MSLVVSGSIPLFFLSLLPTGCYRQTLGLLSFFRALAITYGV